jgi:hypothetical protein
VRERIEWRDYTPPAGSWRFEVEILDMDNDDARVSGDIIHFEVSN